MPDVQFIREHSAGFLGRLGLGIDRGIAEQRVLADIGRATDSPEPGDGAGSSKLRLVMTGDGTAAKALVARGLAEEVPVEAGDALLVITDAGRARLT